MVVRACSQPQGMFLHFETQRSGVGECAGEVPPQTTGGTLFPSAAPEIDFQSHLPELCVTVRPPYASHTLLVDFGPRSASLVCSQSRILLSATCRQAWPVERLGK